MYSKDHKFQVDLYIYCYGYELMDILHKIQRMLLGTRKFSPQIKTTPLPKLIHFALTNVCNLSCPFCWRNRNISNKKRFESAPDKVIDQWLDLINDDFDIIHPGGGGEPLLLAA